MLCMGACNNLADQSDLHVTPHATVGQLHPLFNPFIGKHGKCIDFVYHMNRIQTVRLLLHI